MRKWPQRTTALFSVSSVLSRAPPMVHVIRRSEASATYSSEMNARMSVTSTPPAVDDLVSYDGATLGDALPKIALAARVALCVADLRPLVGATEPLRSRLGHANPTGGRGPQCHEHPRHTATHRVTASRRKPR